MVKKAFAKAGFQIQRLPVQVWEADALFQDILKEIQGVTLVDAVRCYMLYQLARRAKALPGDAAEVGVYRGGTARLLGRTLAGSGKTFHLFDTFAGMPKTDAEKDFHQAGDFSDTSLQGVKLTLINVENLEFHAGLFPDTAAGLESKTFSFVHVDVDIHRSVLDCCRFFYPRMPPHAAIVFDDYGAPSCPGVKAAVDVFFAEAKETPIYLPTGQCVVFKSH